MKVITVSIVRNERDVIRAHVLHHLGLGVDAMLIVDNGSTDGTDAELQRLARSDPRVRWSSDPGPYQQAEITTGLAREAAHLGADWVLPVDADELWSPVGGLGDVLGDGGAGVLSVGVVNFVQRRSQRRAEPQGSLTMTRRSQPWGDRSEVCEALVRSGQIAFVEIVYPPKCISRASAEIEIRAGNHSVGGVDGPPRPTDRITCLHAPLRAWEVLDLKAEHGRRVQAAGARPGDAWHVQRWAQLEDEGGLDAEWAANSYQRGALDVDGARHLVVRDHRLRDAAAAVLGRRRRLPRLRALG